MHSVQPPWSVQDRPGRPPVTLPGSQQFHHTFSFRNKTIFKRTSPPPLNQDLFLTLTQCSRSDELLTKIYFLPNIIPQLESILLIKNFEWKLKPAQKGLTKAHSWPEQFSNHCTVYCVVYTVYDSPAPRFRLHWDSCLVTYQQSAIIKNAFVTQIFSLNYSFDLINIYNYSEEFITVKTCTSPRLIPLHSPRFNHHHSLRLINPHSPSDSLHRHSQRIIQHHSLRLSIQFTKTYKSCTRTHSSLSRILISLSNHEDFLVIRLIPYWDSLLRKTLSSERLTPQ